MPLHYAKSALLQNRETRLYKKLKTRMKKFKKGVNDK